MTFTGSAVYQFTAVATDGDGKIGTGSLRVVFNQAPRYGTFAVSPMSGGALTTKFRFEAQGWQDVEDPTARLTFAMGYRAPGCSEAICEFSLMDPSTASVWDTVLPVGNLTIVLRASDQDGATNTTVLAAPVVVTAATNVEVTKKVSDLGNLANQSDAPALMTDISKIAQSISALLSPAEIAAIKAKLAGYLENWAVGGATPAAAINAMEAVVSIAGDGKNLEAKTIDTLVSSIGTFAGVVLREFAQPLGASLPDSDKMAAQVSKALSTLLASAAAAARRRSDVVQDEVMLTALSGLDSPSSTPPRRAGASEAYKRTLGIVKGFDLVSALSVAKAVPGQRPAYLGSDNYQLYTKRVEKTDLAGIGMSASGALANVSTCLLAQDVAACCAASTGQGQCCSGDACLTGPFASGLERSGGFEVILVPTRLLVSELKRDTYELQLGKIDLLDDGKTSFTSPFKPYSATVLRANTTVAVIREFRSPNQVTDITAGYNVFSMDRPTVTLRLPLTPAVATLLSSDAVTTPEKVGEVGTCLSWDEAQLEWNNKGIFQPPGKTGIRKFCRLENGTLPTCYFYLECYSQHLSYFSVAGKPLDCTGVALGTTVFDGCKVCGGDNSTCSGCDGVPNQFDKHENVKLDKQCSGHGQCAGGQRCKCCINSLGLVKTGKDNALVCPWFGVMCSQFCTNSPLSDPADAPPNGIKQIHCSGHGACVSNSTLPLACECNPGYANRNGLCDFLVPIPPAPLGYELWLFLVAGLPVISCGIFVCAGMWLMTYYKKKAVDVGNEVVSKAIIEKLPMPVLEEVGKDLPMVEDHQARKAMRPAEEAAFMKKQGKIQKKKDRAKALVVPFKREDFKPREKDACLDTPEISAFLTTRAYEPSSTVIQPESNKELLVTYERLKAFESKNAAGGRDTEALFEDVERVEDLMAAVSRNPISFAFPTVELDDVSLEGVPKGIRRQVEAERRAKQREMAGNMPDFLKGHMRKQERSNKRARAAKDELALVKVDLESAKRSSDDTSDTSSTTGHRSNGAETAVVIQEKGGQDKGGGALVPVGKKDGKDKDLKKAESKASAKKIENGQEAVEEDDDGDVVANV